MKTIILVLLVLSVAFADQSKLQNKLTSLLNMQARAVDAVESALQVLRDLKQENIDAQAASDEINRTQERDLGKQIADLTFIADTNKKTGDEATANRKDIQQKIQETNERLVWINKRKEEIARKKESFREHRCLSNMMFIKSLKEHDEALAVIRWLKEDILGILNGGNSVSLSEIKDSASKLSAYAHLFEQNALQEFAQLAQAAQAVDPSTAEWNTAADDNEKSALSLQRMGSGADERDVGNKIFQAVEKLEQHLINSVADLEKSEIEAAWNLAAWLQNTEKEIVALDDEYAVKTVFMDKLLIAIPGAKAYEDRVWEIYFESAKTLNDAIDDLNVKRAWYVQEKARRDEENAVLDEVIRMFIERVSTLDSNMKNKVNTGADIARSADSAYEKDYGRVGSNVESESWA